MRIVPLRLDADGVHRLTVHLHPADLGPVQVVAEVRNGDISVQLAGATEAGREALRNSLGDLKRELQQSGFGNCSLDLRQGSPQQEQARQQFGFLDNGRDTGRDTGRGEGRGDTRGPGRTDPTAVDAPAARRPAPAGAGAAAGTIRLDLHI
jgi:flagellar hook-length control protein FliK